MSTIIIPCPSCSRQLRMPNDRVIKTGCPSCGRKFKVDHGRVVEIFAANTTASGEQLTGYWKWLAEKGNPFYLRPWFLMAIVIALFSLGIWYKTTIHEEKVRYERFAETPTVASAQHYLDGFGDSERAAAVTASRDSMQLELATATIKESCDLRACKCSALKEVSTGGLTPVLLTRFADLKERCAFREVANKPTMAAVLDFQAKYSNSVTFKDTIEAIRQDVLAGLVRNFDKRSRADGSGGSDQRFFRNALGYVAQTGKNVINVAFTQRRALKDWDDYPQETRDFTDSMIEMTNAMESTSYPKPSSRPPGSINAFFRSNTDGLEGGLVKNIQLKMDSIFGEKSIIVRKTFKEDPPEGIVLNVEYLVSTLEEDLGENGSMPSLYIWTETMSRGYGGAQTVGSPRFKGYMLATSIDWDLSMDYPGSDSQYRYSQSSRPQASIENVNSETAALQRMMSTAFSNFGQSFLAEFGVR